MSADLMLAMRGVTKTYDTGGAQVHALREVNLDVATGEMVAVMGMSGSGKSTLLSIAGALVEPDSGYVAIAGEDITTLGARERARGRRDGTSAWTR